MNKSTIVLVTLAALGLGALIGVSLAGREGHHASDKSHTHHQPTVSNEEAPRVRYLAPGDVTVKTDESGQPIPAAPGENHIARNRTWRSETVTIELPVDGAVEYKAIMTQGDTLVFNWATNGGKAYYDFHAHDEAFGEDFFTRYDEGEGNTRSGSIIAAYDGEHGWYWHNVTDGPTTITLKVAGFYDDIITIDVDAP